MVLRSKRESRRTRKPEISIYSETSASGERTRLACRSRRLAVKYPSGIRHLALRILPVDWRGRQSQVATATAPQKIACANPAIVTSSEADEQLRPFTNLRACSCCGRSVCSVFLDTSRQRLAAIAWCIHADANRTDHVCAITLIASGSYEHAGQPPVISAPQFDVCFAATASLTSTWVRPLFLNAHIFAHAPPAVSVVARSFRLA